MTAYETPQLERPNAFSLWVNTLPFLHLATGMAATLLLCETFAGKACLLAAWIYLLPPLAVRMTILLFGRPEGQFTQDTNAYRVWWVLTQWQILFNRLPWLEELLRMVPGLYSLWIGLWGGKVSPFAYIGPRVWITDRHAVHVGKRAVLGMQGILAGHLVVRNEKGRWLVLAATPVVEADAILGGDARLGPGAILHAGHMLPTGRHISPFDEWPRRKKETTSPT